MQLVVGISLDRFGPPKLIPPAIAVCVLGVALFGLSSSPTIAGAGRFLTGLGASFAFVGALYVINHSFPPEKFAVQSGVVNAVGMIGTAVGVVALTAMVEVQGWRVVFGEIAIFGVIILLASFAFLRGQHATPKTADSSLGKNLRLLFSDHRLWLIAIIGALFYMPINVYGGLWGQSELTKDYGLTATVAEFDVSMIFWGIANCCLPAAAF